ncbi:hypothetical protein Tco_1546089 [Tanacetum coccineum]
MTLVSRYNIWIGSSAAAATRPIGGRRVDYGFVGTMDTEIRRRRAEEGGRAYCSPGAGHVDINALIEETQDRPRHQMISESWDIGRLPEAGQLTKALELLKGLQT